MRIQSGKKQQQPQIRGLGEKSQRPQKKMQPRIPFSPRITVVRVVGKSVSRGKSERGSVGPLTKAGLPFHTALFQDSVPGSQREAIPHTKALLALTMKGLVDVPDGWLSCL